MRLLSAFAVALLGISAWAAADVPAHAAQIVKPPAATVQPAPAAPPTASPATGPSAGRSATDAVHLQPGRSSRSVSEPHDQRRRRQVGPEADRGRYAGIRVDELSVRGIMQSRERLVAMVQGADNRTYLIHQGDKLADGVVKSITPQGLVLVQDVSDPHATDKTREVRKLLRTPEDDKE
jgi:Tfp pilus assembly protein PilP